jgi:hypothetical protein
LVLFNIFNCEYRWFNNDWEAKNYFRAYLMKHDFCVALYHTTPCDTWRVDVHVDKAVVRATDGHHVEGMVMMPVDKLVLCLAGGADVDVGSINAPND